MIYSSIFKGHLHNFDQDIQLLAPAVVTATVELHSIMLKSFLPNAIKFHYMWNLRELANVFQGLMQAQPNFYRTPTQIAKLWCHEVSRVYGDRLMFDKDMTSFAAKREEVTRRCFPDTEIDEVLATPNLFASWCTADSEARNYLAVKDFEILKKVLDESLREYNEVNAAMELVLFEMFMEHVVRISRIIEKPRGNCMLVGVGGSGKQSLTKLTSFIVGATNYSIQLTGSYNVTNLKEDMLALYIRAGSKSENIVWMLTDSQVVDEIFLVYVNDFLSSGFIPDLFDLETKNDMINAVRNEVKAEGIVDTNDNCWDFFLEKVVRNASVHPL